MKKLRALNLTNCGKLRDVKGLEGCEILTNINLINCKKLISIDALLDLPYLEQILLRGSGVKRDNCPVRLLHIADWRSTDFNSGYVF